MNWLDEISTTIVEAAIGVIDADLKYLLGWPACHQKILDLKNIKKELEYHRDFMRTGKGESPFADPHRAQEILDCGELARTKLHEILNRNRFRWQRPSNSPPDFPPGPPGPSDPPSDPGGGGPPLKPKPKPPQGGGGGILDPLAELNLLNQIARGFAGTSTIVGVSKTAEGGFATLTAVVAGLAMGGGILASMPAIREAVRRAKQAHQKANEHQPVPPVQRYSEMNAYCSYLAEWLKEAAQTLQRSQGRVIPKAPLDYTTWRNRQPPVH